MEDGRHEVVRSVAVLLRHIDDDSWGRRLQDGFVRDGGEGAEEEIAGCSV